MSDKMHLIFNIDNRGKVNYSSFHEDGDGVVWGTTEQAEENRIAFIRKASKMCRDIESAIKHLDWPT